MASRAMRFGLVGTGYWARATHAPALASTDGIEFSAVWGRNPEAAAVLAADYQAKPYQDLAAFLAAVDGVAFAVPPDVQAPIATRAAADGKHLLLEKPVATSEAEADGLADAVERAGVASVVFFTHRFRADVRHWLADVTGGDWLGGVSTWFGSSFLPGSPFNTPWRTDKGALWDIAPHVISLLWAALGPVTSVTADAGPADVAHLVLHHRDGPSSTVTVTQAGGEAAAGFEAYLWGAPGRSFAPVAAAGDPVVPLRVALAELTANARSGRTGHPCDVRFGRDVGRLLADAQRQIDAGRRAHGDGSRPGGVPGALLLHNE